MQFHSKLKFPIKKPKKKSKLKVKLKVTLPQVKSASEIKLDFVKYDEEKPKY